MADMSDLERLVVDYGEDWEISETEGWTAVRASMPHTVLAADSAAELRGMLDDEDDPAPTALYTGWEA